ncbi:hypothetical protein C5E07_17710 [Pseudoclavibacter sp. RFBJ3]|uniref:hypothetical protein n=1 Tax=unclassified Pseudoclavibacter TaxID=2615177 RepID=UPI000CE818AE|nr:MULTISPECIES: hypothetical protein [unclassified Pseudoclavibacter]MBF4457876.1 hypothetical protein [Pseudoclavibacter sp. VKM Ac-2867]PPF37046.1 hypothetical protein C5E05_08825 [Pseudoclavibacter sp. AY1H1]PPF87198.1 hypothetical protein C5C12_00770 [Pseudoclavibacter sp. RFBJ5]PPF89421.1 hypothetical protein C5E07_17710 [Pseudoclavibacter sp. RFBJ3]PPG00774.1 hypothetical protein C5C19_01030 [Pseudoclavibacter sp. RFBH5]
MRLLGTILLAIGFIALASAVLITDPTALDANIGAGILQMAGFVAGGAGLAVLLITLLVPKRTSR